MGAKHHPCMSGGACRCGAECGNALAAAQSHAEKLVGPIEFSDEGMVKTALLWGGLLALAFFGGRYLLRRS